jgi:hypothetical protein
MRLYDKIKWVLGILLVFVLIVTTNLIDRNNFVRVRNAVVTIYEDRLIANDLIFEMLRSVQEKEVAVALKDTAFFQQRNSVLNQDIQGSIRRFEQTKLTTEERKIFNELKNNIEALKDSEKAFEEAGFVDNSKLASQIANVKRNLYDLTKIQLDEGGRQVAISQKAIDTVELFTQIEIYLLVFLAVLIQIIVMYKPRKK